MASTIEFWRALCPDLTVSEGGPVSPGAAAAPFFAENRTPNRARLAEDGYFVVVPHRSAHEAATEVLPTTGAASAGDASAAAATAAPHVVFDTLERLAKAVIKLKEVSVWHAWQSPFACVCRHCHGSSWRRGQ
jgi:hypothetical protein